MAVIIANDKVGPTDFKAVCFTVLDFIIVETVPISINIECWVSRCTPCPIYCAVADDVVGATRTQTIVDVKCRASPEQYMVHDVVAGTAIPANLSLCSEPWT